jgi:hypothetical protein
VQASRTEPEIERDLVAANAPRAAAPPGRSARQARLHVHVDVLELLANGKGRGDSASTHRGLSGFGGVLALMTPVFCNIAACARDPAKSCAASRPKPMEVIACISSADLSEKRPPHMAWPALDGVFGASEEERVI